MNQFAGELCGLAAKCPSDRLIYNQYYDCARMESTYLYYHNAHPPDFLKDILALRPHVTLLHWLHNKL